MCFVNVQELFMLLEIIREHIRKCGKTRYRIAQDTGIDEAALCRIMQGGSCLAETCDILIEYFELELVPKKKRR